MKIIYLLITILFLNASVTGNEILNTTYLFAESNSYRKLTVLSSDSSFSFVFYKDDLKLMEYSLNKYRVTFPEHPTITFPRAIHQEKRGKFSQPKYYYDLAKLFTEDSSLTIEKLMIEIDSSIVFSLEPDKEEYYNETANIQRSQSALDRLKADYRRFTSGL